MSGFRLRDAGPADVPDIHRLVRALAEYERLLHEAVATEADFHAALFGPDAVAGAVMAEAGGRAVGFALWYRTFSTFTGRPGLYVEDVFVEEAQRGSGIGGALFRHLARHAVARGWTRMEWQVLDWNAPAIRFYDALGSRSLEEWRKRRLDGEALSRLAREPVPAP